MLSRTIKVLFLSYLLAMALFLYLTRNIAGTWMIYNHAYNTFSEIPLVLKLTGALSFCIYLAAAVTVYRLLSLYEKGIVFSGYNVRLLGRIGYLAFSLGLINVCAPALISGGFHLIPSLIAATGSPWILGGLFIVLVSCIMNEGRKIQEEQELTV